MTVALFGAILCSSLYLLDKFTNVDIFESEVTFTKRPNGISKIGTILPFTNEIAFDANKDNVLIRSIEQKVDNVGRNVTNGNAILLFTEVVEEASRTSRIQHYDK